MRRAELFRQEQLSLKTIKVVQHHDKVRVAKERKDMGPEEKQALQKQIYETKMQIAELRVVQHRQKQLLKAQEMGTTKVLKAQKKRELLDAEKQASMINPNKNVFKVKLVYQIHSDKLKERNYEIMKNLNRKRYQSVNDRRQKAQSLNEKLKKADERRELIIKKKVEKAKDLGLGNSVVSDSRVSNVAQANSTHDELEVSSLMKVQQMPINPQSKHLSVVTQCESESDFEIVDGEIDTVRKEKLESKLNKAEESHKQRLQSIIQKARDSYTKYGPSEDLKKKILDERRAKRSMSSFRKPSTQFFVQSDDSTQGSEKKVKFIVPKDQVVNLEKQIGMSSSCKNFKSKRNSIAFEIDRVVPTEKKENSFQTSRKSISDKIAEF